MSLDFLKGKSILVTGGTGSFGHRFISYLLANSEAAKIIIFSRDEHKQNQMRIIFAKWADRLRFFLGDIRDLDRLEMAFRGVDYVVHAAALKHVPLLEYNPFEAIMTNIMGTQNVIKAALSQEIKKVILVSTDKAANPANLYGATKLCAERLIIGGNVYSGRDGTKFSVSRYGNVIGSRGSLVDIIKVQKPTGEITVTHQDMTRFWLTLEQGIKFVLKSLEMMIGGEIFVPKMPSMKVVDFIKILAPECKMQFVGIRPGEKIHEVLITTEEARHTKEFDDYYVILPEHNWWDRHEYYAHGQDLGEGFNFVSNNNIRQPDCDELKGLLKDLLQ